MKQQWNFLYIKCRRSRAICVTLTLLFSGIVPLSAHAENVEADFGQWLQTLRQDALAAGISDKIFDDAFKKTQPIPRIIELDRKQPEFTWTFKKYLSRVVSEQRIKIGKKKFAENRALLEQAGKRFGVQPRFLAAFWGVETSFGRVSGGYQVIDALATLAFDGRRSKFFRRQLIDALRILEAGHTTADKMTGSWAGAMGQVQFMPSTFQQYAIDGDDDGHIDIWGSKADAFSSAANYLSKVGWRDDITWGREIKLPKGFDHALVGRKKRKMLHEWQALGVRRLNNSALPDRELKAAIVQPDGPGHRAYLVYSNFDAILNWNRSDKFGIAVGTLANEIVKP